MVIRYLCLFAVFVELGDVYTFGSGSHGKLGHGNDEDVFVPRKISWLAGRAVDHVACGQHRLLATIRTSSPPLLCHDTAVD